MNLMVYKSIFKREPLRASLWICLSCPPIAKRTHVLLAFFHTYVLLASDFHELWHRVRSISLLTEVKQQWAMLVLGWVTVSVRDQLWDVSKLEFLCVTRLS